MNAQRSKDINRESIEKALQEFFEKGGKVQKLPDQVIVSRSKVGVSGPYLDLNEITDLYAH